MLKDSDLLQALRHLGKTARSGRLGQQRVERLLARLEEWPYNVAVRWLVSAAGVDLWMHRSREFADIVKRYPAAGRTLLQDHHIEICLAMAYNELQESGELTAMEMPFPDAYAFATMAGNFHDALNETGRVKHIGRIRQALKEDYGFASLRTEYTCWSWAQDLGCQVTPIDFLGEGNYDFLLEQGGDRVEAECKMLTTEYGSIIRHSSFERLWWILSSDYKSDLLPPRTSRILWLELSDDLPRKDEQLRALAGYMTSVAAGRPSAQPQYVSSCRLEHFPDGLGDPTLAEAEAHYLTMTQGPATAAIVSDDAAMIIAISRHFDNKARLAERFTEKVTRKLKDAASQLTGSTPGLLFIEIQGPSAVRAEQALLRVFFTKVLDDVFRQRPFVHLAVLAFAGPPFTAGAAWPIRNTRVKRRNLQPLVLRLERAARPTRAADLPFRQFRDTWWEKKLRWRDYKSASDVRSGHMMGLDRRDSSEDTD